MAKSAARLPLQRQAHGLIRGRKTSTRVFVTDRTMDRVGGKDCMLSPTAAMAQGSADQAKACAAPHMQANPVVIAIKKESCSRIPRVKSQLFKPGLRKASPRQPLCNSLRTGQAPTGSGRVLQRS